MKTPKERDNLDLLTLVCELSGRSAMHGTKELHDAYMEARKELETRFPVADALPGVGSSPIKENILATVADLVGSFLYYDRKEDEELPRGAIQEAIKNGAITTDEILAKFKEELMEGLSNP